MDGLAWYKGSLIGVHNSPYFRRIIRIDLRKTARQSTR
jgi:hypothetical protein